MCREKVDKTYECRWVIFLIHHSCENTFLIFVDLRKIIFILFRNIVSGYNKIEKPIL